MKEITKIRAETSKVKTEKIDKFKVGSLKLKPN